MKKVLVILVFMLSVVSNASAESQISVYINGQKQSFKQQPILQNGSSLVPLRGIFESLGAKVEWDGETETVTAVKGTNKIVLKIGSTEPTVNGLVKKISVPGQLVNGSTMVPLRFVSEALGAEVSWNGKTKTIDIHTGTNEVTIQTDLEKEKAEYISMLEDAISNNIHAMQEEDLELLASTLSANAIANGNLDYFEQLFKTYDIEYEVKNDLKLLEINEESAILKITATVKKVSGPDFNDNNTTVSLNYLVYEDGGYKFDGTDILETIFHNLGENGNTDPQYQHDADIVRLNHLVKIASYIEEYKDKVGHYPLVTGSEIPSYTYIATDEQEKYINDKPPYKHTEHDINELIAILEEGLERDIAMPNDPQRVPVNKPNFYVYMTHKDYYVLSIHLHNEFTFTTKISDYYNKLQISNNPNQQLKIWSYSNLIQDDDFKKAINAKMYKKGYFEKLENELNNTF